MMTDTINNNDDTQTWREEIETSEYDPQLPSFTLGLLETGDEGSSYRTLNDPAARAQRENYVERKGAIDIRCSCVDVVHGLFSPEGKSFATLIILDFRFDIRKRARRISLADIVLEFVEGKPGETGPEVLKISPVGTLSLVPTTHVEAITHSGNVSLGGGGVVTAAGTVGWEKSISKDKADSTTVIGSIDLSKTKNFGSKNCASWTLIENTSMKSGIPVFMRSAILLKRKHEKPFKCVVTIKATVDIKSSIGSLLRSQPKDDPVEFDPELPPTNRLQEYDLENLGSFDLDAASDLTFSTVLTNVVKERVQ